jgi:hypothetical protein
LGEFRKIATSKYEESAEDSRIENGRNFVLTRDLAGLLAYGLMA